MKNCLEIKSILKRKNVSVCTDAHTCAVCVQYMYGGQRQLQELVLTFCDVHQDQTQAVGHGGWGRNSLSHLADPYKLNLTRYSLYFKSQALLVSVIHIN